MSVSNLNVANGFDRESVSVVSAGLVAGLELRSLTALRVDQVGVGRCWEDAIARVTIDELDHQGVCLEAQPSQPSWSQPSWSQPLWAQSSSETSSTALTTNFAGQRDFLTGESLEDASMLESPVYPGYLLIYEPGRPLEARPGVAQWQARMQQRGWTIAVDGFYGPESERVARQFQQEKGLAVDGIVGADTWQAAFAPTDPTIDNPVVSVGRINAVGLELIKDFEGLRLNSYQDAVGVWTIGYGHTRTAGPGQRITDAQATALLREDVANFENAVTQAVQVPMTANQFAALVSFTYNVGSGALNRSTLLRKLNAGDTLGAADEFLRWNRAGGQELAGLTRRRIAERELFLS